MRIIQKPEGQKRGKAGIVSRNGWLSKNEKCWIESLKLHIPVKIGDIVPSTFYY